MSATITFDSIDLLSTDMITRFIKHDSAPPRELSLLPIARADGSIYVTQRYAEKSIKLEGVIIGTSQADLETNIDYYKEVLSREQKSLVVDWNGATRVYVATCKVFDIDRDHFNNLFVPFAAEFVVASGEGRDAADTLALNDESEDVTTPIAETFDLLGTKNPRPTIRLTGGNWPTDVKGIQIDDTDTGERMTVCNNAAWGTNSYIEIDCNLKTVKHVISGVETALDFHGTIPNFKIGTNGITLSAGHLQVISTTEPSIASVSAQAATGLNMRWGKSFTVPYTDTTFQSIRIPLKKFGSPAGNTTIEIRNDTNGSPGASVIATFTKANADITTSKAYYDLDAGAVFTLNANTTYWIILYGASYDNSNGMYWGNIAAGYEISGSVVKLSTDSGGTWNVNSYKLSILLRNGGKNGAGTALLRVTYKKTYL